MIEFDSKLPYLHISGKKHYLNKNLHKIMTLLTERRGEMVTRDDIRHHIWPDVFVQDQGITVLISKLRKITGKGFIKTHKGLGYWIDK